MKKISLLILIALCSNCSSNDGDETSIQRPILTTKVVTNITSLSGVSGGHISDDGGSEIITRGICWDINKNPTLVNNSITKGAEIGGYTSEISNLENNTNYYVRAFATNSLGTSYGNEFSFKTLKNITYEVVLFEFTPDTGNNTSRLKYEIKLNNSNNVLVNGFYKISLNIDGVVSSKIASSSSECYEIGANSSCTIRFDEEESLNIGLINSIELVSVEYHFEN